MLAAEDGLDAGRGAELRHARVEVGNAEHQMVDRRGAEGPGEHRQAGEGEQAAGHGVSSIVSGGRGSRVRRGAGRDAPR
jgi:hypothetical protein